MAETKQPAAGIISSVIIMAISLAFISLFELSTFTGWVAYCIECMIPMQIVIGITWATKHPHFAGSRSQPMKGLLLALVTVVTGAITGALFFYTVNGGKNPPTPFLLMFIIIVVLTTFGASIIWGGWPFMQMIKSPVLAGFSMLAASYLVTWLIFRVFFNYAFLRGAPVYDASLDPHGMFNAWNAVVYYVTVIGVMFADAQFRSVAADEIPRDHEAAGARHRLDRDLSGAGIRGLLCRCRHDAHGCGFVHGARARDLYLRDDYCAEYAAGFAVREAVATA